MYYDGIKTTSYLTLALLDQRLPRPAPMVATHSGAKVVLLVVLAEAFGSSANDTAWQPWEQIKKYVLRWFHPAGHGHSQHFLHHEAAPWTKAHVAGREALGEEFEMTGWVERAQCILRCRSVRVFLYM